MSDDSVRKLVDEAVKLRYSRRQVLKRASALGLAAPAIGVALAASGHSASAATRRAPAVLQGTSLNILAATYFVPDAQTFYEEQVRTWGEENNVDVTVDFINWPDLQPRISSAVQAESGPDIIEMWDTWPYLYYEQMVPMGDLAQRVGDNHGGFYEWVINTASVDGEWYSVPHGNSTTAMPFRISYVEEAGISDPVKNFPQTWEEFFALAKELKAMGKPVGQALGQSLGDPPGFAYPFMWSYGAMEVEDDGKTVAFNKPEFVDAMEMFIQAWEDGYDETGLSWDDSVNNSAYLSDQISATLNGSSIYIAAKKSEADGGNPAIAEDTYHANIPGGPAGQFNALGSRSYGAMNYSENVEGATAFLEWWFDDAQYVPWLEAYQGYIVPPGPAHSELGVFTEDPKLAAYANVVNLARNKGYAGPANEKAAQVSSNYIIVNTFANAIQSGDASGSIEQGAQELERFYNR